MKITKISLWTVPLTSHEAYYMAAGKSCETVDTVIIRIETDTDLSGWGEVCPIPHYLPAYAKGVAPAITDLAPVLIGADPLGPAALIAKCEAWLLGHPYAKSPIDMALWDITAKAAKMPLYVLLGGRRTDHLPLYHSITCIDPDEMARIAKEAYAQGIRQFQAKLGVDQDAEADIARLRLIREAVGPGPLVYGDWNCGAAPLEAIRVARAVADIDLMLEQPCETITQCASVHKATGLAMKLDENAQDTASLLEGAERGCMQVAALKLSKFGGVSAMCKARDLCTYLGTKMCIEDTWGSDIATAAALHIGASTDPRYVLNVCDLSGYVSPRLDPTGPARKDGYIMPPSGNGLGVTPDTDLLGPADMVID